MGVSFGNGMLQDFSLFLLKFFMATYIFLITVGSDFFMRLDFHD